MRFMSIVKATRESEAGARPDPALMAAIGKMGEEAMRAGVIVDMGGLAPSAMGARVRASGGKLTVVDGPFAERRIRHPRGGVEGASDRGGSQAAAGPP
jgi:hypothetical protein